MRGAREARNARLVTQVATLTAGLVAVAVALGLAWRVFALAAGV